MIVTTVIVWDRNGRLAAGVRTQLDTSPANVVEVNDEDDFREALRISPRPIVLLDRASAGDRLADSIAAGATADSLIVVMGSATADESRRDRDLGAHLLLAEPPMRLLWSGILQRLVRVSQQRVRFPANSAS